MLGSIDAAEEAFQEAVLAALRSWRAGAAPANPAAWLTTAAKNHAHDVARHRRIIDEKAPLLAENEWNEVVTPETLESISDDELRLIFTCCHPVLTLESQVALTLKVVAGFTTEEIARAFLSPEKTVAQRIVRAKRTIEEERLPYQVPERAELPGRLASVLAVVYLVFNEGHTTRDGALMRLDLQAEALRLGGLLCNLLPNEPEVFGVFALIAFSVARATTRTDDRGELLLLSKQDRSRWDRPRIKEGLMALQRTRRLGGGGSYVLQAEIAACHATAETWDATDWSRILGCYDVIEAKNEWTGTQVIFEIARKGDKTEVRFTHAGLVPEHQCYGACSRGWGTFINGSLRDLIASGKGQPNNKEKASAQSERLA
jgi:RNA polymerase sigma-70 factor (ECF subfamily)